MSLVRDKRSHHKRRKIHQDKIPHLHGNQNERAIYIDKNDINMLKSDLLVVTQYQT